MGELVMYQSFEVNNFRCFRELRLTGLDRVNLIAGKNNVGKTALLEAIFLHCGAYNPELALRFDALRGIEAIKLEPGWAEETPWDSLFNQFDTSSMVELKGINEQNVLRILRLKIIRQTRELTRIHLTQSVLDKFKEIVPLSASSPQLLELECVEGEQSQSYYLILDEKGIHSPILPPPPPFPAIFLPARVRIHIAEDASRFGKLEMIGRQDLVLKALQVIEPRLRRLAVVVVGGVPVIHGDIGLGRLMPLPLMGEGMARLNSLVLAIANAPKGVILVDEIENGLHHSVLPKVWRAIGDTARAFDTQVFATTHSFECIVAAHKAFSEGERYDFRLHRLDRVNDSIRVVTYDQETVEAAIEMGLEVR